MLTLPMRRGAILLALALVSSLAACAPRAGSELTRKGDEIIIAGRAFHTGTPVVLWTDPGGYDAYRTEKRFVPWVRAPWKPPAQGEKSDGPSTPARFGIRYAPREGNAPAETAPITADDFERVRGGGWDLPTLQRTIDQFVLHYDVCGVSQQCFRILHDVRGLSVHFMLDIDGTIYQTMDVKEKGWHATVSNDRSVGIEIANIGAYSEKESPKSLNDWYEPDPGAWSSPSRATDVGTATPAQAQSTTSTSITIPDRLGDGGLRVPGTYAPRFPQPIYGTIQGRELRQYDLTPQQYDALIKLTAALCTVLPEIRCDYPRDAGGNLIPEKLSDAELAAFKGVLGHFHIQKDKIDPGPALDWDRVIVGARKRLGPGPRNLASGSRDVINSPYDAP